MRMLLNQILASGSGKKLKVLVFAEGEKALSGNVQTDIKFCLGKISLLEEKIEALETAPQNVPVTQYRQEDEIDPSSLWWWERWGEEDPSDW